MLPRCRVFASLRVLLLSQGLMAAWLMLLALPEHFPFLSQRPWPHLLFSLSFRAVMVMVVCALVFAAPGGVHRLPRPEPRPWSLTAFVMLSGLLGSLALARGLIAVGTPLDSWLASHFAPLAHNLPVDSSIWQWPYVLRLLNTSVGAPIGEELLFRLYLYGQLRFTLGRSPALILSTLLFTAWHWGDALPQLLGVVGAGCIMALVFEASGRISASIMVHGLYNLITLLPLTSLAPRLLVAVLGGAALVAWAFGLGPLQTDRPWQLGYLGRRCRGPALLPDHASASGE